VGGEAVIDNPFSSSAMKERLSLAYIQAVAARAGFEALETRVDIDSVDGMLRSTLGRRPQIDFQAKATSLDLLKADHVAYPLRLKNYNELRAETINPRILIVVVLPPEENNWMSHSEDELVMRRCGYWISLFGSPATDNATNITVKVPRTQLFDVNQLKMLMARAQTGPVL
jgi:Domain of unknown function (DUF4365)